MKHRDSTARKGRQARRAQVAIKQRHPLVASDCPLACKHLVQLIGDDRGRQTRTRARQGHPIEVFARAYGVTVKP